MIFADTITFLFEEMAQLIVEHQPLVETYYGMFLLLTIVSLVFSSCFVHVFHLLIQVLVVW